MTNNLAPERPVGPIVSPLPSGKLPDLSPVQGRWMRLDALDADRHVAELFQSISGENADDSMWTYMAFGPFPTFENFTEWLKQRQVLHDPWFYTFVNNQTGKAHHLPTKSCKAIASSNAPIKNGQPSRAMMGWG